MNILIAVASRHGSTREIADTIAQELCAGDHAVDAQNAGEVDNIQRYDAAIVGSAVYMGNWLPEARQFVHQYSAGLAAMPVWLFSSGPIGQDNPQPADNPVHLDELMQATGAREHRIFVGKLDKSALGVGERLAVKMVKAPYGDYRDWEAIRAWAHGIAAALPIPTTSAL